MDKDSRSIKSPLLLFYGLAVAALLLVADYFSGPFIQFPISYLIPVAFLSWFNGRRWGLIFAVLMPLVRLYFNLSLWNVPWTITEAGTNALIRVIVLSSFALLIDRVAIQTRELSGRVSLLEGLLPICSHCKKIRIRRTSGK